MSCVSWTFLPPDLRPLFALMMRWTIPIRVALAIHRQRSAWTSKIERWDMSRSPTHHAGQVADDDCGAERDDQQGCASRAGEHEPPLAAGRHHPGIGQRHRMLRDIRLPLPQEPLQVADAPLARTDWLRYIQARLRADGLQQIAYFDGYSRPPADLSWGRGV